MKKFLLISILLAFGFPAMSQNWASIGRFNQTPDIIWYDSVDNRLYVAGNYTWFESVPIRGFGYVQGNSMIPLGCGFEVVCGMYLPPNSYVPKVTGLARYHGELYVTGWFEKAGGVIVNGIAKWGGNDWIVIGSGLAYTGGSPGVGNGLEVINDELYLYGSFDSVNGIAAHGIAMFNGQNWASVFDLPRFTPSNPNAVFDAEWFRGELYVGGNFNQFGSNPHIQGITKWDGTDWVAVGNGFSGFAPGVMRLLTYKNKLIVAGHFNKYSNPGSIPGNGITAWDGYNWDTLRGGLQYRTPGGGSVSDIAVYNDELHVVGGFDSVGGVPARNIAKWDGERWCGVWDQNDFYLGSIGFYNDSMFVGIDYGGVGGQDSITKFAKWIGGDFGDSCQMVGIEPSIPQDLGISIFPNPVQTHFSLALPQGIPSCVVRIVDLSGREVLPAFHYASGEVDVAWLAKGVYLVAIEAQGRRQVVRLLRE
jgi:hypothetical protein